MTLSTQEIFDILQKRKPISIVRAGDGEKIVLDSFADVENFKLVLKRQLGFYPPLNECEEISENLKEAYRNADIIGVPMHHNLSELNSHWQRVEQTLDKHVPIRTKLKCSIDVGYDMLYNGMLEQWLTGQHTVCYVSCRNIDEQLRQKYKIRFVHSYIIAPEMKFTTYEGKKHYPDQFNEMEWWMNSAPVKGNPCLVGAGAIGKIYTNWFRDRGGTAIDLGAVFDLWAGKSTRGPKRGLDAIDETYKL